MCPPPSDAADQQMFCVAFCLVGELAHGEARDEWLARLWAEVPGVLGLDEGTLLAEDAAERGFETESFVVDAALAPRERDWVGEAGNQRLQVYLGSTSQAEACRAWLQSQAASGVTQLGPVEAVAPRDWMAEWKASYTGVDVAGLWSIRPTHRQEPAPYPVLWIEPGAGFGTGTHPTTALCLEALGSGRLDGQRVLDFGSGSGILAIAAARLGATSVAAVEIDELANDNARSNARANRVGDSILIAASSAEIPWLTPGSCDVVIANILRPVLMEHAAWLVSRLSPAPHARLILSGLVTDDQVPIESAFGPELMRWTGKDRSQPGLTLQRLEREGWIALAWGRGR